MQVCVCIVLYCIGVCVCVYDSLSCVCVSTSESVCVCACVSGEVEHEGGPESALREVLVTANHHQRPSTLATALPTTQQTNNHSSNVNIIYIIIEREVMEACLRQLACHSLAPAVKELLAPLVTLFAAAAVERELSWYLCQELIPAKVNVVLCFVLLLCLLSVSGCVWCGAFGCGCGFVCEH